MLVWYQYADEQENFSYQWFFGIVLIMVQYDIFAY